MCAPIPSGGEETKDIPPTAPALLNMEVDTIGVVFTGNFILKLPHIEPVRHIAHMRGNSHGRIKTLHLANRCLQLPLVQSQAATLAPLWQVPTDILRPYPMPRQ